MYMANACMIYCNKLQRKLHKKKKTTEENTKGKQDKLLCFGTLFRRNRTLVPLLAEFSQ